MRFTVEPRLGSRRGRTRLAILASTVAIGSAALLASAGAVSAKPPNHPAYILVDPGTLGGPQAFLNAPGFILTKNGALLGTADTAVADAYYPNFNPFVIGYPDAFAAHAFAFQNG